MVGTERMAWAVLDIIGMVILAIGVCAYVEIFPVNLGEAPSLVTMGIGIVLIFEASVFIHLEGIRIARILEENERRQSPLPSQIPDDSDEGYIIDYTAIPREEPTDYAEDSPASVLWQDEGESEYAPAATPYASYHSDEEAGGGPSEEPSTEEPQEGNSEDLDGIARLGG
ncbi:MAG: hypothetical protein LBT41_05275 [Candidatus Methanoplasma sp.]|jgi:hypothetical protein|nr:hypothetical protein [Candidatus Methanoplasma sp.]